MATPSPAIFFGIASHYSLSEIVSYSFPLIRHSSAILPVLVTSEIEPRPVWHPLRFRDRVCDKCLNIETTPLRPVREFTKEVSHMNINTQTQLCGVLGNPVEHSLSPAIHNAAFQHLALNFVYLAFPVKQVKDAVQGIRALGNLRGFSVTIPHKISIMEYLDVIDPTAKHIGAINTIVKTDSTLTGYNTDASGALQALRQAQTPLADSRVLIVGSGGAARAIAFGLVLHEPIAGLTILGIMDEERTNLAADLRKGTTISIEEAHLNESTLKPAMAQAQILIHCTPLGMSPKVDETCVPRTLLAPHLTVMDIVYNPGETRLLREAREKGCSTIPGLEMFLYQAAAQFELWTGRPAPTDIMRTIVETQFS